MTLTTLQAPVTRTATLNGTGVDISALTGDFTIIVELTKLSANAGQTPQVQFEIQDSVDAFTNRVTVAAFNTKGSVNYSTDAKVDGKQHGRKWTFRRRDLVGVRAGTPSATLRLALVGISGTGASADYSATIQIVS